MANEEQRTPGMGDEVPAAAGPEGATSGPAPQAEGDADLTVEDILGQEQNDDARSAEDGDSPAEATDVANEYLEDLRRVNAEYANYRKRTEENRVIEQQRATAAVLTPLLGVLDDLDRADAHGDLVEGTPFHAIAQKLRGSLERFGLESFGQVGDLFDPALHEAIAQVPVPGTEAHTVLDVVERGYRIGGVELRAAKVAVAVGADG
ncbi:MULTISPECIES: nucleotide exchange factor GrpE [unclassified Leucobacter]|uniref:nucleotide exchange factor GrpE n=1 Tax=unclassified Leucobacter TaxID=2621730 RepID=UPI00165D89CF|nr:MULTISPECIES: nucleotide exchange factor GrpE [unclassified Leucobacter]MBC9927069.1 nucleotide exchange factor GrpE [Leucobacter sp. cx-169]